MRTYLLSLFILIQATFAQTFVQVYFTPRDNIKQHLIELISHERKSIEATMYMLTDKEIAAAFVDAYVRGVQILLILDQASMSERFGKGLWLQKNGIPILVHQVTSSNPFQLPIMHHKFFIFGYNDLYKKSLLWTGSFNCTQCAAKFNDENVILCDDISVINEYRICFKQLSQRILGKKSDVE